MKKYEFTGETKLELGTVLKKIRALIEIKTSFGIVKAGEEGGWIEKEDNLSHNDNAWVCDNALVCDNAWVYGNAWVCDNAWVYDNAKVYGNACVSGDACVSGNAKVYGDTKVYGDAKVYGDTKVYGDACVSGDVWVCGNAWVCDNALVYGDACVSGDACVCGDARVSGDNKYMIIGPIGSRNDFTTFFWTKEKKIYVKCDCFRGNIDEFREKVRKTHGDNEHAKAYYLACDLAELRIGKEDKEGAE